MTITNRRQLAFALAPIFPSLFFLVVLLSAGHKTIMLTLLFSLPISYISCLLFGMPLVSFLKRINRLNIVNVVMSGAIVGAVVFMPLGLFYPTYWGHPKV
jgi:hypothetical protein